MRVQATDVLATKASTVVMAELCQKLKLALMQTKALTGIVDDNTKESTKQDLLNSFEDFVDMFETLYGQYDKLSGAYSETNKEVGLRMDQLCDALDGHQELSTMYDELIDKHSTIRKKRSTLDIKVKSLTAENNELNGKNNTLIATNASLVATIASLTAKMDDNWERRSHARMDPPTPPK